MRIADTVKLQSTVKCRIADRVSAGAQFHSRYLDIAKRAGDEIPSRLPAWSRQYLSGYLDAKLEALWRLTDFRYQLADGQWVNAHSLEYGPGSAGEWVATHNPPAAHFW